LLSLIHSGARSCLVVILATGLINVPAMAATESALGMVVVAQSAHLGGTNAVMGANLFSGDVLDTDSGGELRWKVGSSQLYLLSASSATLSQQDQQVRVKLGHGTVGFSSAVASQLEIETPVGIVRSADGQRGFGQVTIVGPLKILVTAYSGALVVERNSSSRTIAAGESYNVSYVPKLEEPAEPPAPSSPLPSKPPVPGVTGGGNGALIFELSVVGATALAAALIWHYEDESDNSVATH